MRIVSVETFPVSLPLIAPFEMSQLVIERSSNVLVKVTTDEGIVGWGEGVEAVDHTGESRPRILAAIHDLASRLVGEDPLRRNAIWAELCRPGAGRSTAISAIDIALHDIAGKVHQVPVFELLGGATRATVEALTLLGSGDTTADLATFEERYEQGYRWFKLKLGIGSLDDEATTILAMASAHADAVVCGDANAGWSERQSARFLEAVAGSPVRFLEQPTRDREALVRLAGRSPVALCADEGARSLDDVLAFGSTPVAGVSLKLIKLGGITGVMRGAALCEQVGLHVNLAGKIAESAISSAANLHCAAAMSDVAFGCSPTNTTLAADVAVDPPAAVDGTFTVPTGPGLGIEVDEARLRELAG